MSERLSLLLSVWLVSGVCTAAPPLDLLPPFPSLEAAATPVRPDIEERRVLEHETSEYQSRLRQAAEGSVEAQYALSQALVRTHEDYEQAMRWLQRAARGGHRMARLDFGRRFITRGEEDSPRFREALHWLEDLAAAGDAESRMYLPAVHWRGRGTPRDYLHVLRLSTRGTADSWDLRVLGEIYEKGLGVPVDPSRAVTYYEKALALEDDEAALPLAELLVSGAAGKPDYERAAKLFTRAIENAHDSERACLELAKLYEEGLGVAQNDQTALLWYVEAAKQVLEWAEYPDGTCSAALLKLGGFAEKGRGAPRDLVQAADYYARSRTMQGLARAAWLYDRKIAPRDHAKATLLLEEALQSGAVDFWLRLEELYPERGGEPEAFREAARLLEKAEAAGSVAAKFHLGLLIRRGLWQFPDKQPASTLISEAASAGYVPAMLVVLNEQTARMSGDGWDDRTSRFVEALSEASSELPRLSLTSLLLPQPGESPELIAGFREVFRLAAKRQAQRVLAGYSFMIQPGVDVEQALNKSFKEGDDATQWLLVDHWEETGRLERAIQWYQGAANAGYAPVQYELGIRYALGYGVPADRITAYKWLSLALAQDFQPSGRWGNHAQALDDLEAIMTPADVVAAQREALDWWRKHRPFKLEPLPKLP